MNKLPILYSFRRCPYAIRARLALAVSGIDVDHKEVILKDKPAAMLKASPKGTVPVLILNDGKVIDESLDIMLWALGENDPEAYLGNIDVDDGLQLIHENDFEFKNWLDKYKYSDRFLENPAEYYRKQAEIFIAKLEEQLSSQNFLAGKRFGLVDAAIVPFIRQFAHVDKGWFFETKYERVILWLKNFLESELFQKVMQKHLSTINS